MSLSIASLNSGSNGNCYYIGNEADAVLVDAGISCRETVKRMAKLELSMEKVRAIFISHEHADHINGLEVLSKKYSLPVFITSATLKNSQLLLEKNLVHSFKATEKISFGDLNIAAFPKYHDAKDPHSFVVASKQTTVGVFTDIGKPCEQLLHHFSRCDAAFLESNYDEDLLFSGSYPFHLKKRISNGFGHLSNSQALNVFLEHRSPNLSCLLLSHLSRNNNSPELVMNLFSKYAGNTNIAVASRYGVSAVYNIQGSGDMPAVRPKPTFARQASQLSMF